MKRKQLWTKVKNTYKELIGVLPGNILYKVQILDSSFRSELKLFFSSRDWKNMFEAKLFMVMVKRKKVFSNKHTSLNNQTHSINQG